MKEEYLKEGLKIVQTLNAYAYQAYIVGGAVRDYIMKNELVDVDIATSATPDELAKIYPAKDLKMEYSHLGCVILKQNGYSFEISTFKMEEYLEKTAVRIPNKVYYSTNLIDDIARRDFTVNAVALTDKLNVVDLVGGVKDIAKKRVRTIGNAKKRFKEDPLRILRAYELVARFNFNIEPSTASGIRKCNKDLKAISNYQISKALYKIFDSPYGKKAIKAMIQNNTNHGLADYSDGLYIINKNYHKLTIEEKFALCFAYKNMIPTNTSFDKVLLAKITNLLKIIAKTKRYKKDKIIKPQDIIKYGLDDLLSAVKINHLIRRNYPNYTNKIKNMYKNMRIKTLKDLKIKGNDIVALNNGIKGSYISEVINELASEVVIDALQNEYSELARRAKEIIEQMNVNDEKEIISLNEEKEEINEALVETSESDNNIDLVSLKIKYDFLAQEKIEKTYQLFVKEEMSQDAKDALKEEIALKIKKAILEQNPEYQILEERGLLK